MNTRILLPILVGAVTTLIAAKPRFDAAPVSGHYLEVRSCDVYTGSCFANAEMGLTGKEGILVWTVTDGDWQGTPLQGLSVIAVVKTADTLGDQRYNPRQGRAVMIVDANASSEQQRALIDLARTKAGGLIHDIVSVHSMPIESEMGACAKSGCAKVKAGNLVEVATRCLGGKDHLCGNEENYYPPLTQVDDPMAAFTELSSFQGKGLDVTWKTSGMRSAYLASFNR